MLPPSQLPPSRRWRPCMHSRPGSFTLNAHSIPNPLCRNSLPGDGARIAGVLALSRCILFPDCTKREWEGRSAKDPWHRRPGMPSLLSWPHICDLKSTPIALPTHSASLSRMRPCERLSIWTDMRVHLFAGAWSEALPLSYDIMPAGSNPQTKSGATFVCVCVSFVSRHT